MPESYGAGATLFAIYRGGTSWYTPLSLAPAQPPLPPPPHHPTPVVVHTTPHKFPCYITTLLKTLVLTHNPRNFGMIIFIWALFWGLLKVCFDVRDISICNTSLTNFSWRFCMNLNTWIYSMATLFYLSNVESHVIKAKSHIFVHHSSNFASSFSANIASHHRH